MNLKKIDELPKTFILMFQTGDELAAGLVQFAEFWPTNASLVQIPLRPKDIQGRAPASGSKEIPDAISDQARTNLWHRNWAAL